MMRLVPLVLGLAVPVSAQLSFETSDTGVVTFSDGEEIARVTIIGHTPEWNMFQQDQAAMELAENGRFGGSIDLPDPGVGSLRFGQVVLEQGRRTWLDYQLEFVEDSPLTGAYISAYLPTDRFAGKRARLLPGVATTLPEQEGDPGLGGGGVGLAVECGDGFEFALVGTASGSALVQDNRRYGAPEFEFRFPLVQGDVIAGQKATRGFTALLGTPQEIDALVEEMHPPMSIDRTKPFIVFHSSGDATVQADQKQLMTLSAAVHGVGWTYTRQPDGSFSASGDTRSRSFVGQIQIPPETNQSLRVLEQVSIADEGVDLSYDFNFPEGGTLNGYQVSLSVPISQYKGQTIRLEGPDATEWAVPDELDGNNLFSGTISAIDVAEGTPEAFRIETDGDAEMMIQDNRGWGGDTIELRFHMARDGEGVEIAAGTRSSLGLSLTFAEGLQVVFDENAGTDQTDTDGWIAYTLPWDSCPVDLSFLNADEAGAQGFVTARDGKFVFSDTGNPVRFWGTNFSAGANFPTHEQAERIAERLKRFGVNIVRTHHADADWAERSLIDYSRDDSQHFDEESLDRFDYLIYCLKRAGIYVYLDQLVNRQFRPGDDIPGYETIANNRSAKPYSNFDPRLIELQKLYSKTLWSHVNPYTELAYKDDPAIALMEFANENDLFAQQVIDEPFRSDLEKRFRAWALELQIDLPATDVDFRDKGGHVMRFLAEVQRDFYSEMETYLSDEVGVKIPMTGSNWGRNAALLWALKDRPFTDSHTYFAHPHSDGTFDNRSQTLVRGNTIGGLAFNSMVGKPFFVSEWDQPWPNEWRAEYPLLMAASAALQDWNGLTVYTYRHSVSVPIEKLSGAFETFNDPTRFGLFPTCALIFRRGDVSVAEESVVIRIPEEEALGKNSPGPWGGGRAVNSGLCEEHRVRMTLGDAPGAVALSAQPSEATEVQSDTGQLWRSWEQGYGTIDTPGTQAVYGYPGEIGRAHV